MSLYARVQSGSVLEYVNFDGPITDQSTLPANKPKLLPVVEINKTYNPVTQVQLYPAAVAIQGNARVTWTYTNRNKNAAEINEMRKAKIDAVHNEATNRLLPTSGASASQQLAALTRLVQLLYKYTDRTAWSAADKNIVQQSIDRIQSVDATRTAEDNKVTELQALVDPAAINAYDPTTGWPAS